MSTAANVKLTPREAGPARAELIFAPGLDDLNELSRLAEAVL